MGIGLRLRNEAIELHIVQESCGGHRAIVRCRGGAMWGDEKQWEEGGRSRAFGVSFACRFRRRDGWLRDERGQASS
jgi:hypothetical protein